MQKIKIVNAKEPDELEDLLNQFIESLHDMTISHISLDTGNHQYTAIIVYKEDYWGF